MNVAVKEKRYDRERWLQTALDVLASEGGARLRVEAIAKALNVTKGSFYHHFKDRSDFVDKVSEYWADKYTHAVISEVGEADGDGREKLTAVFQMVARKGLNKYDIAFRSWAAQDSKVADMVRSVDKARYTFVRHLFVDMGFSGVVYRFAQDIERILWLPEADGTSDHHRRRCLDENVSWGDSRQRGC